MTSIRTQKVSGGYQLLHRVRTSVTSSSGRFFLAQKFFSANIVSQKSKCGYWLNRNDFFLLFFLYKNRQKKKKSRQKADKNCIRFSHHFGFVLKWNISNQVAFSAYPCKFLRKVNLNHTKVCNLALQLFSLKASKKVFFKHLWVIHLLVYRVFFLSDSVSLGSSQADLWYTPAGPLFGGGCFSLIRLDPLDLPALRKTYNKHIFDPSKPPLGNWKKGICQYSKLKEKKGGEKENTFLDIAVAE